MRSCAIQEDVAGPWSRWTFQHVVCSVTMVAMSTMAGWEHDKESLIQGEVEMKSYAITDEMKHGPVELLYEVLVRCLRIDPDNLLCGYYFSSPLTAHSVPHSRVCKSNGQLVY